MFTCRPRSAPFFAFAFIVVAPLAHASDMDDRVIAWYAALEKADARALSTMLSSDAEIILKDVNITQDRETFLNSMEDWALSIEGGSLRHKILSTDATTARMEVCYDFSENDILMRETLIFEGTEIIRHEQEQLANKC